MALYDQYKDAAEAIDDAEYGVAFLVQPDGQFEQLDEDAHYTLHWHGTDEQGRDILKDEYDGDVTDWEIATGMTGQYSYNGPLMHESEYFGEGVLASLMEDRTEPLVVALAVVGDYSDEAFADEDSEDLGAPFSWVILYREPDSL